MTETNRVRLTWVDEVTPGTTPNTPRMRTVRTTGESVKSNFSSMKSDQIRDDRMNDDPIPVDATHGGQINGELHFPPPGSPESSFIESLMESTWVNAPARDNDGVADSVITAVTASSDTYTVTTGAAFVAGHLVRATGFAQAGNNSLFKAQSGSGATAVVAPSSPGLTDESAPAAAARLKVVGFEGASGDITALADGLGSTSLDLTTLGIVPGMWLKVGGTADATTFAFLVSAGAAARKKAWARVSGTVTATKIPLDNLPSGWATDSGTSKTIQVFFGDYIKNGTTKKSGTLEKGFLGQAVPTYLQTKGQYIGQGSFMLPVKDKAKYSYTLMGMVANDPTTTPLDASPDAASTSAAMATSVNVGRLAENGSRLAAPNFVRSVQFDIGNNLRPIDAIRDDELVGPSGMNDGEFDVSVKIETYFGDSTLLTKWRAGTPTSVNAMLKKNNQAIIFEAPRLTYTEGDTPSAGQKNSDVYLSLTGTASKDSTTSAQLLINRLEYYAD